MTRWWQQGRHLPRSLVGSWIGLGGSLCLPTYILTEPSGRGHHADNVVQRCSIHRVRTIPVGASGRRQHAYYRAVAEFDPLDGDQASLT